MPIYEYRCSSCGHEQEFLQKLSDPPMTVCTACGKATLSKMLTAAGFQLKGSGWYATDFKNKGAAPAKSDSKAGAKASPGADASSTEAKPASESKPAAETKPSGESKTGGDPKPAA